MLFCCCACSRYCIFKRVLRNSTRQNEIGADASRRLTCKRRLSKLTYKKTKKQNQSKNEMQIKGHSTSATITATAENESNECSDLMELGFLC